MVKPFISNKSNTDHNDIILIEEVKQIRDGKEVAEKLNNVFADIIHITTGKALANLRAAGNATLILPCGCEVNQLRMMKMVED